MGIYSLNKESINNLEKEFDLGKALRSTKYNIIFCNNIHEDVINEYVEIYKDNDSIHLMVRNREKDNIKQHGATSKIIYKGVSRHNNDLGIPILFNDNKWSVYLGNSPKNKALAQKYTDKINKKKPVKEFLNAIAEEIGDDITFYSTCNPDKYENEMKEIVSNISKKYKVEIK